jgi:hypothetical protein
MSLYWRIVERDGAAGLARLNEAYVRSEVAAGSFGPVPVRVLWWRRIFFWL